MTNPVTWFEAGETGLLLAPGAGTNREHPLIAGLAQQLAGQGVTVMTFDYPYAAAGKKRPDRPEILTEAHRAAAAVLRARVGPRLLLAGRSMGGRIGSILAAEGEPCAGLVCYAYPLHPAGRPDTLRVEHLSRIAVPALFFQGSRDALSRGDLFDRHIRPWATVIDMIGADHSFRIPGLDRGELNHRLAVDTAGWVAGLGL